jgi:hypothetical protein
MLATMKKITDLFSIESVSSLVGILFKIVWKLTSWNERSWEKIIHLFSIEVMDMLVPATALFRFLLMIIWIFTSWIEHSFLKIYWSVFGFIFFPTTLVWTLSFQHLMNSRWGIFSVATLIVSATIDIIGLIINIGHFKRH